MPVMIINIPNNLPISTTNKRPFPALSIGRDMEPRVVELFCFFRVVWCEIFCQKPPAGLRNCLGSVSLGLIVTANVAGIGMGPGAGSGVEVKGRGSLVVR